MTVVDTGVRTSLGGSGLSGPGEELGRWCPLSAVVNSFLGHDTSTLNYVVGHARPAAPVGAAPVSGPLRGWAP